MRRFCASSVRVVCIAVPRGAGGDQPATATASTIVSSFESRRWMNMRPSNNDINQALNVLKVDIDTDPKEMKKKYLSYVRIHHPDKGGDAEKMKNITAAYDLLQGLSKEDKKAYKQHFSFGSRASAAGRTGANMGNKQHHAGNAYDFQNRYRQQYERTQKPFHDNYGRQSQTHGDQQQSSYQRSSGFDPFGASPTGRMAHQMSRQPMSVIVFRAFIMYIFVSVVITALWRLYRDYLHDDGWAASNSLSRHERLEDVMKYRMEQRDASQHDPFTDNSWGARKRREAAAQARVMSYAEKRAAELNQVDRLSWPTLRADGSQGQIFRYPTEPIGVTHYAPPRKEFASPTHPAALVAMPGNLGTSRITSFLAPSAADSSAAPGPAGRVTDSSSNTARYLQAPPFQAPRASAAAPGQQQDNNTAAPRPGGFDPSDLKTRAPSDATGGEVNPLPNRGRATNVLDAMTNPAPAPGGGIKNSGFGDEVPGSHAAPTISRAQAMRHIESTFGR